MRRHRADLAPRKFQTVLAPLEGNLVTLEGQPCEIVAYAVPGQPNRWAPYYFTLFGRNWLEPPMTVLLDLWIIP